MADRQPPIADSPFEWIGGHLALDFVNTVSWGDPDDGNDRFTDYAELVAWAVEGGVLTEAAGRRLRTRASADPSAGVLALKRARELRVLVYAIFSAVAAGDQVSGQDLRAFNGFLGGLPLQIVAEGERFRWEWPVSANPETLGTPLYPVVWSGAELLVDDGLRALVKICANDRCGWLFVDESRRRNRRWCDMRDCGNRAKARRYYRRHRSGR